MRTLPTDRSWKNYGKKEPYFGVFGIDTYLIKYYDEKRWKEFFSSGKDYVTNLFNVINEKIDAKFKPESILDFGCGPRRMILPFSCFMQEVTGVDILKDMLMLARLNCKRFHVTNASFNPADDFLNGIQNKKYYLVHSYIVLQHLNTRRGSKVTKSVIKSIKQNGIGVLHYTYHDRIPLRKIVNYFRNRIPFLATTLRFFRSLIQKRKFHNLLQMQMKSYKINRIFSILQKEGIKEIYSTFTDHHNYWGVTLFFKMNKINREDKIKAYE